MSYFNKVLLGVIVAVGVVVAVWFVLPGKNDMDSRLKLVLPTIGIDSVADLDTARIRTAQDYIILSNLYSPLFQSTDSGEIQGVLADSVEWRGNQVHIRLRSDLFTQSGYQITAKDAVFSLKRLMVLKTNTHARLQHIFPTCSDLESVAVACDEIQVVDELTFSLEPQNEKIWLLETLTSQDFGILPMVAVDLTNLRIANYRETSGPFYVSSENNGLGFTLNAQKSHPLLDGRHSYPQSVEFLKLSEVDRRDLPAGFIEKRFNYYPKYFAPSAPVLQRLKRESEVPIDVTKTQLNFARIIRFTARGMKELSKKQRFQIGNSLTQSLKEEYSSQTIEVNPVFQFYTESADGALSQAQLEEVITERGQETIGQEMKLDVGCLNGSLSSVTPLVRSEFGQFTIREYKDIVNHVVAESGETREPHFYYMITDADPKASLSGVTNVVTNRLFHQDEVTADAWLKEFAATESRQKRVGMLQKAHKSALISGQLIPIYAFPGASVVQVPWSFKNFPTRIAVDALWLLTTNF